VKSKDYGGHRALHNFMLEEVHDYGPVNLAKFARYIAFLTANYAVMKCVEV
jgi:hypothetical protein